MQNTFRCVTIGKKHDGKEEFRLSLRRKLTITIITCILITGLSATLGFHAVLRRYNRSLYNQSVNLNHLYSSVLSDEMSRLVASSGSIATDQRVQALLLQEKEGGAPLNEARHFLSQSVTNKMTGIFLFDREGPRLALGNTGVSTEILSGLARHVLTDAEESWASAGTRDGSLLLGRRILSSQPGTFMQSIGALILRINIHQVLQARRSSSAPWNDNCFTALFLDGSPVFHTGKSDPLLPMPEIGSDAFQILALNDQSYFVTMDTLEEGGSSWRLYFGLPYSETMEQIALSRRMVLIMILAASLLAFAVTALVMRRFTQNYIRLVGKMNSFKRGAYHPASAPAPSTGDELVRLNQTFDEMAVSYDRMTRENYEKQLLLMQARLKNLEQQLDPHFLFNTLETVNYFAKRCGEENIPKIVSCLADLLQYSLRGKSDCVSLRQETGMLNQYLYIQQLRFSDILFVWIDFNEDTLAAMIPKMTLQPLVENAIRYTLEEEESCELRLSSRREEGDVLISVADNGPPLEKDLLEKLRSGEKQPRGNGIGLLNVDTRHKLLFGEKYGLTFGSVNGMAAVIIRIPADGGSGEEDDVPNDSGR